MPSCCDTLDYKSQTPAELTVALAGNPNSGKTTIFNALTGLRQKVANYPGVTVEKKTGRCKLPDSRWANIIDLPGTYSLISRSPDEQVAMEVLRGLRQGTPPPDAVIVVVDASNLQRNLYLVSQLIELGRPLVVALNMMDIAERRGLKVSPEQLEAELGVPVIPVVGHKKKNIDALKAALQRAAIAPMPDWPLPQEMREELALVAGALGIVQSPPDSRFPIPDPRATAERLLIGDHAADLDPLTNHDQIKSLLTSASTRLHQLGIDPMQADIEAHYRWIDAVTHRVVTAAPVLDYQPPQRTLTQKVDAVFIHKIWGLVVFTLIMATLFVTLFWAAKPIMDFLQDGSDKLGALVTRHMSDGPLKDLITSGIFKGVGAVIVFVPQIAMLFFFLSILEDSGYLARAAFLMDRVLAKVGLHGKSFIPLLSSFACAIPGIMATRTIENRKDRLATILIAPFMSCSARLPVYTLLIGTFFATRGAFTQAGIMLACYGLGIIAAAGTAWIFKRSLLKGGPTAFILELPTYKVPQASEVGRQVWKNTWAFVTKAGTTIFCLSIILWAMAYYPRLPASRTQAIESTVRPQAESMAWWSSQVASVAGSTQSLSDPQEIVRKMQESPNVASTPHTLTSEQQKHADEIVDKALAAAQSEHSLAGRMGHAMEPLIRPLGYDWKMGVGLVGAFAAREVFVSTMGIVYSVGRVESEETKDLSDAMRQDKYPSGKPVWTPLVAISLLIWFVLAQQCMSTLAIVRRETGGWGWPIFMLVYMNGLAYVACLAVFQIGRLVIHA